MTRDNRALMEEAGYGYLTPGDVAMMRAATSARAGEADFSEFYVDEVDDA